VTEIQLNRIKEDPVRTFARRFRAVAIAGMACFALLSNATAQDYPTRVIQVIVPWPAGGAIDIVARIIANKLPEGLGRQVIVDNRAGANGFIGTMAVARAEPDGYTLLLADVGTISISPAMRADTPYNPLRDFIPITQAVSSAFVLVVHPKVPANTLQELVAHAKAHPGKLTYGSFGHGSIAHLSAAMLHSFVPGLDMLLVPY
jgi:tripartite-type tricarboxylate transporter receptor subunit TctC